MKNYFLKLSLNKQRHPYKMKHGLHARCPAVCLHSFAMLNLHICTEAMQFRAKTVTSGDTIPLESITTVYAARRDIGARSEKWAEELQGICDPKKPATAAPVGSSAQKGLSIGL